MDKNYIVLTSPCCGRCMVIKNILTSKGIPFREVSADSEEGKRYVKVFDIRSAGVVIDVNTQKLIEIINL